jgi:hypothetical protein
VSTWTGSSGSGQTARGEIGPVSLIHPNNTAFTKHTAADRIVATAAKDLEVVFDMGRPRPSADQTTGAEAGFVVTGAWPVWLSG